jgi:hypothetical protein
VSSRPTASAALPPTRRAPRCGPPSMGTPQPRPEPPYRCVRPRIPTGRGAPPVHAVPECLALNALAGPNGFLTDPRSIDVGSLPAGAGQQRLTIVLVDAQGIRQGAVTWTASFRIEAD